MRVPGRTAAFVALSVAFALVFVRLGVWQLERLEERKADNAKRRAAIVRDTVRGVPDYAAEVVIKRRSHNGSPGVHIVTPVIDAGGETTFVNRGWVYAADAATVDLARWHESRDRFSGYLADMPGARRRYLVARDSAGASSPVRLPEPDFSNGPHLSYAIQWFCFATIALVGAGVVLRKARGLPKAEVEGPIP